MWYRIPEGNSTLWTCLDGVWVSGDDCIGEALNIMHLLHIYYCIGGPKMLQAFINGQRAHPLDLSLEAFIDNPTNNSSLVNERMGFIVWIDYKTFPEYKNQCIPLLLLYPESIVCIQLRI